MGGASQLAHQGGIDRVVQAGGKPVSWIQVACELQRDWNRAETAQGFAEIVLRSVGH